MEVFQPPKKYRQNKINIQNAQKECKVSGYMTVRVWQVVKVIHNPVMENAEKMSYTRSYKRYPHNTACLLVHFFYEKQTVVLWRKHKNC